MRIIIIGTGEVMELHWRDPKTWIDHIADFPGMAEACTSGEFREVADEDYWLATAETFEWWAKVLDENGALEERLSTLKAAYGHAALEVINHEITSVNCDFEDHAGQCNALLDSYFGADNETLSEDGKVLLADAEARS